MICCVGYLLLVCSPGLGLPPVQLAPLTLSHATCLHLHCDPAEIPAALPHCCWHQPHLQQLPSRSPHRCMVPAELAANLLQSKHEETAAVVAEWALATRAARCSGHLSAQAGNPARPQVTLAIGPLVVRLATQPVWLGPHTVEHRRTSPVAPAAAHQHSPRASG